MKTEKSKLAIILDAVCGTLMLVCTLVYLLIGVVKNIWHPTWIIIVVGGFVCALIGIISDTVTKLNARTHEEQNNK
mgnify:FL=1